MGETYKPQPLVWNGIPSNSYFDTHSIFTKEKSVNHLLKPNVHMWLLWSCLAHAFWRCLFRWRMCINSITLLLIMFYHSMECRYNWISTCHTYHPWAMEFLEGGDKVFWRPTHIIGGDQLEVKRSKENFVGAWNYFLLKEVHVIMTMKA